MSPVKRAERADIVRSDDDFSFYICIKLDEFFTTFLLTSWQIDTEMARRLAPLTDPFVSEEIRVEASLMGGS